MTGYMRLTELDDPAKAYKSVWLCEATGIYVKVHAVRREIGLGKVRFDFTGSLSDETGTALTDADGQPLIHIERHGLSIQTDTGIRCADARDLLAQLLANDAAETVEVVKSRARALFADPPTSEQIRMRMAEDFEREQRFMVAKVERAVINRNAALDLGGVKAA